LEKEGREGAKASCWWREGAAATMEERALKHEAMRKREGAHDVKRK